MTTEQRKPGRKHIKLTSHPGGHGPKPLPIAWGDPDPKKRVHKVRDEVPLPVWTSPR